MFTVVCKPSEAPYSSDDYLPSVMTCVNYLKLPDYSRSRQHAPQARRRHRRGTGRVPPLVGSGGARGRGEGRQAKLQHEPGVPKRCTAAASSSTSLGAKLPSHRTRMKLAAPEGQPTDLRFKRLDHLLHWHAITASKRSPLLLGVFSLFTLAHRGSGLGRRRRCPR